MIELVESTAADLDRIQTWTRADAWHKHQSKPDWWLTGNGFLSFLVRDAEGPIIFTRIDREDDWFRVHCQFAPREVASRERVVAALDVGLQHLLPVLQTNKVRGLRFDSENPSLIRFLRAYGFDRDETRGDYVYRFEGVN